VAGGEWSISNSSNGTNTNNYGLPEDLTAVALAKRIGAAVLAIEHRYFGTSVPFMNLTDMRYNSVEIALPISSTLPELYGSHSTPPGIAVLRRYHGF